MRDVSDVEQIVAYHKKHFDQLTETSIKELKTYLKEMMNKDSHSAWAQHVGGSSRLVFCRQRSQFTTDFECAMFRVQVDPIVSHRLKFSVDCADLS